MIDRAIEEQLRNRIGKGKVLLLYGPGQVGKKTLLRKIAKEYKTLWLMGTKALSNIYLINKRQPV